MVVNAFDLFITVFKDFAWGENSLMAHAIIEYSENLEKKINFKGLTEAIHDACIQTGVFPIHGMRTRTAKRKIYKIADGSKDAGFIHLLIKMGPGRDEVSKEMAMEHVFNSLIEFVKSVYDSSPLALSIEIFELPKTLRMNKHNLKKFIVTPDNEGIL